VDELFAVPVHQADVHLMGVKVDSAVELCGGTVIFHSVRQKVPRGTDYVSSHAGKCLNTSPPVRPDVKQKPKGLRSEYQIAAGNAGWPFQFRFASV
jgi:hypothetical protein